MNPAVAVIQVMYRVMGECAAQVSAITRDDEYGQGYRDGIATFAELIREALEGALNEMTSEDAA